MVQVTGSATVTFDAPPGPPGPPGAPSTVPGPPGVKGDKGDPGTPADMSRVTALEATVAQLVTDVAALKAGTSAPPSPGVEFVGSVGNSFAPGHQMPHAADGSFRHADGTLFTAARWEEAGGELCVIAADGSKCDMVPNTAHGWQRSGGQAVTADATYIFQAMSCQGAGAGDSWLLSGQANGFGIRRYLRSNLGFAPFTGGIGRGGDMLHLPSEALSLAVSGSTLYAWCADGQVRAFNTSTMAATTGTAPSRPPVHASGVDGSQGGVIAGQAGKTLYGLCFLDSFAVTADGKTGWTPRFKFDLDGAGGWSNPQPLAASSSLRVTDRAATASVVIIDATSGLIGTRPQIGGAVTAWLPSGPVSLGGDTATMVDPAGNIWTCTSGGAVSKRTRTGTSWSAWTAQPTRAVSGFTDVRRWQMTPDGRFTVVSGLTSALPDDRAGWMTAGRVMRCYDQAGSQVWELVLPWAQNARADKSMPSPQSCQSYAVTNRYVAWAEFAVDTNVSAVHVLDVATGTEKRVVPLTQIGWLDITYSVGATDLTDGRLAVTVEDDWTSRVRYMGLVVT